MDSTIELPSIGCDPVTPGKVSNVNTDTDPMMQEVEALIPAWFTLDDAARELGIEVNRVRQLLAEGSLVSVRRGERSLTSIPALFFSEGEVVKHLGGTLTVLKDSGYSTLEALRWLFTPDESLPGTPIEALRENRGTEVKRRAQALAL
ncbi:DNA-binding proteinc [mine drainage metagenome]|uniref:DNA-binding proteinc n=1 Tax=mine drainage metagenome TaxID=410659 RepID=A0A1J5Q6Q7_9ZZZZ